MKKDQKKTEKPAPKEPLHDSRTTYQPQVIYDAESDHRSPGRRASDALHSRRKRSLDG